MVDLLLTEFQKQKRDKFIPVTGGLIILYLLIMAFYVNGASGLYDNFISFYKQCLGYFCFLILPLVIALLCINVFSEEYRADTIKYLWTVPVSKGRLILAKTIYIEAMSLMIMLFVWLFIITSANLTRFSGSIDRDGILRVLYLTIANGLIIPLAVIPVSICVVICKGNTIVPTMLSMVYIFCAFLLTVPGAGIVPLSSTTHIIWFNNFEGVMTNNNIALNVINLIVFFILGMAGTAFVMKKQNL